MHGRLLLTASTALLAFVTLASATVAQQETEPELYSRARAQLAAADTLGALMNLLQLTERYRNFAPGWGLLGQVLTDNPAYLATLARLMRKQQVARVFTVIRPD